MGKEKKSTIKFQKTKLKGVLKRRKETNKFKKQINKRQLRRLGTENPHKEKEEEALPKVTEEENVPQVNTEDYFCNFVLDPEEPLELEQDEEEDLNELDEFEGVKGEGKQKVTTDNEDDEEEEEEEESEEESEDEYEEEDEDMEDGDEDAEIVTMAMLDEWTKEAENKSTLAWKKMLLAFRSIVRSDEEEPKKFTYRVESSKVYTKLVRKTLKVAYPILSTHIYFLKKEKYPGKTKNFPKLEKTIQLFLNTCVRFLRELSQDELVQYVLDQLLPCTLYFGCFPILSREYLRVLLDRWSDPALSEDSRHGCYKALKALSTTIDGQRKNYMPNVLKGLYLTFAHRATKINSTSLPVIQQMAEEAADIYSVEPSVGFEHASVYLRQLADHLKQAKKEKTVESFKKIYTWQFISCLDFWSQVLSIGCDPTQPETALQGLIQPVVDLMFHTIRLNPLAVFLPLRFHLIRTLTGLMDSTGFYIPLAAPLFEVLSQDIFKHQPQALDLPEFEWDLHLKTPKLYLQSKNYQDAVFTMTFDSLLDFYACNGLSIAFPELAIPAIDKLKEYLNKMKKTRFAKALRTLIEKLESQKNYIEQKRAPIEYTPAKLEEARAFLRSADFSVTPLGSYLKKKSTQKQQYE